MGTSEFEDRVQNQAVGRWNRSIRNRVFTNRADVVALQIQVAIGDDDLDWRPLETPQTRVAICPQ